MTLRDRLVVLLSAIVLAVLGGSLVHLPSGPRHAPLSPPAIAFDRVLDEGAVGPLVTLDPLFASSAAERDASALLFRGLTRLAADGVEPDLAQDWSVTDDGATWTFRLRRGARWHDGSPVTADDVVFTVRSIQHPDYAGPLSGAWRGISVERVDDRTVRFTVSTRVAGFLYVTTAPITPAAQLAGVPIGERAGSIFGRRPVGNGPYRLLSLDGSVARLERVDVEATGPGVSDGPSPLAPAESTPDPLRDGGSRALDGIAIHAYDDATAVARAFARGEIEAAGGLTAGDVAAAGGLPGARVVRYPRSTLTAAFLNLRADRPEFSDVRTRRGLLLAVDREAIVRDVLGGEGSAAAGLVPPSSPAFDATANDALQHDAVAAAELLATAGWTRDGDAWQPPGRPAGKALEIATVEASANAVTHAVAQRVAADWRRLGVAVDVVPLSAAALAAERLEPREYDVAIVDVALGHDPDLYPLLVSSQAAVGGTNVSGFQSEALDALLESARGYAPVDVRRVRLRELQRHLASELPLLPIVFADYRFVVSNRVVGPAPREVATPQDRYWDVLTWRTADGSDR